MASDPERERFTLKRWSQRKHAAAREMASAAPAPEPAPVAPAATHAESPAPAQAEPLPSVESLSFDDDFTAFMKPEVDPSLRREALKKLFRDPRFNVMDGLDVYIDDYTKSDPIPPSVLAGLAQARYLFDPPKTRINERGEVEDVPPEAAQATSETPAAIAGTAGASSPSEPGPAPGPEPAAAPERRIP